MGAPETSKHSRKEQKLQKKGRIDNQSKQRRIKKTEKVRTEQCIYCYYRAQPEPVGNSVLFEYRQRMLYTTRNRCDCGRLQQKNGNN